MDNKDLIFLSNPADKKSLQPPLIPKRYIVTAFTFFGFVNMYYLRTNLSVAIIEMTSNKTVTYGNKTYVQEAEFNWNSKEVGIVLSSFAYGCLLAPIGGVLASNYGGATIFGIGIGLTAILTVLTPILLRLPFYVYLFVRLFEGIFESFSMTSYIELFAHWSPPEERSRLIVLSNIGMFFGITLNYPLSGYIAKIYGWEAVFYISGGFAIIWYFFWLVFVRNDPSKDKFMSKSEKLFLKEQINYITNKKELIYPWKKIFKSKAVWAYVSVRFSLSWGYSFTALCLPLYIKDVQNVNINEIGLITSIPNLCALISQPCGAYLTDFFRKRKSTAVSKIHRLLICFGCGIGALTFLVIALWSNFIGSIIFLSVFRLFIGFTEASVSVLPVDMAPRFASLLTGISTTFYAAGVILNPTVLGFIVTNHIISEWKIYFLCITALNTISGIIFLLFGSGNQRSWALFSDFNDENL